ncbi:MAG: YopX family protein [Clostridia bacterium]|nr:YopX family protein [Clostridia bacterium]
MSEILHRAQQTDGKGWVFGDYMFIGEDSKVCGIKPRSESDITRIPKVCKPETVGRYTEFNDKNGKRIFEHDIVLKIDLHRREAAYFSIEVYKGCWVIVNGYDWDFLHCNAEAIEVVGNIFDNPELMEIAEEVQDG